MITEILIDKDRLVWDGIACDTQMVAIAQTVIDILVIGIASPRNIFQDEFLLLCPMRDGISIQQHAILFILHAWEPGVWGQRSRCEVDTAGRVFLLLENALDRIHTA